MHLCFCLFYLAESCFICGGIGKWKCLHCSDGKSTESMQLYFCTGCNDIWHKHPRRVKHVPELNKENGVKEIGRLQLLSVLCIETSHYVCFTRIMGPEKDDWVFFDSMAERPGEMTSPLTMYFLTVWFLKGYLAM